MLINNDGAKANEQDNVCFLCDVNEKLISQKVHVQLKEINGTKPKMGNVIYILITKLVSINIHIYDIGRCKLHHGQITLQINDDLNLK